MSTNADFVETCQPCSPLDVLSYLDEAEVSKVTLDLQVHVSVTRSDGVHDLKHNNGVGSLA